ncbi:MAG: iron-siderophore ABC transporter substrate-binding protein [Jaaginema sp. PMC 1079.18]|nr:iron-siderophore ABC transporter substrate-binding protein [Jaaginema sp. PMC 1080.18]MEC4850554.1 iron-siderophore ABC transporter substrate-binding protein [Jaaginema sp. PMC 1079.18]
MSACQPLNLSAPLDETQAHVIHHNLGETLVPNHPQRIITLGNAALETALAVGIKPVGAAPWVASGNVGDFPGFLSAEQVEGIEYLGDVNQPSLEKMIQLKPDLILGNQGEHQTIYPILSKIAPTVLYDPLKLRWQENLRGYGMALNQEVVVRQIIQDYDRKIVQLQASLGEKPPQVTIARFLPSQVRLYENQSHIRQIMQDAGLKPPAAQNQNRLKEVISLETIPKADAEIIFIARSDPRSRLYRQFTQNPLWQNLKAVQSDRVYFVNFEYWIGGEGAIAANLVLDDLLQFFATTPD